MSTQAPASIAAQWWRQMQPTSEDGTRNPKGDRAGLARLRRYATVADAMQEPATIALFRMLGLHDPARLPDVALTAAVLASVRKEPRPFIRFARAIGPKNPNEPETAVVKPLRFRRLMEADTVDERLTAFRRTVTLADRTASPRELAGALLFWTEKQRQRWIFDYWNAADSAPTRGEAQTDNASSTP